MFTMNKTLLTCHVLPKSYIATPPTSASIESSVHLFSYVPNIRAGGHTGLDGPTGVRASSVCWQVKYLVVVYRAAWPVAARRARC